VNARSIPQMRLANAETRPSGDGRVH
jgi:hypothetical protein